MVLRICRVPRGRSTAIGMSADGGGGGMSDDSDSSSTGDDGDGDIQSKQGMLPMPLPVCAPSICCSGCLSACALSFVFLRVHVRFRVLRGL